MTAFWTWALASEDCWSCTSSCWTRGAPRRRPPGSCKYSPLPPASCCNGSTSLCSKKCNLQYYCYCLGWCCCCCFIIFDDDDVDVDSLFACDFFICITPLAFFLNLNLKKWLPNSKTSGTSSIRSRFHCLD